MPQASAVQAKANFLGHVFPKAPVAVEVPQSLHWDGKHATTRQNLFPQIVQGLLGRLLL
jgi:hypothetical protein